MSTVVESKKILSLFGTMVSYCAEFYRALQETRIAVATVPGFSNAAEMLDEERGLFLSWISQTQFERTKNGVDWRWRPPKLGGFFGGGPYHRWDRQFLDDWWPPYAVATTLWIPAAALPQEPQVRRILKCGGFKRTIRIGK